MCCCSDSILSVRSMAQRDVVKWAHIPLLFVPSIYCNCKSPSIVKPNYFKLNLFTFVSHLFVVYIVWLWHNVDRTKYHKKKHNKCVSEVVDPLCFSSVWCILVHCYNNDRHSLMHSKRIFFLSLWSVLTPHFDYMSTIVFFYLSFSLCFTLSPLFYSCSFK